MTLKTMMAAIIAIGAVLAAAPASAGAFGVDTTPGTPSDRQAFPVIPVWDRDWDGHGPRHWQRRWHDDGWRGGYRHRPYPGFYGHPYGWNRWDATPGLTLRFGSSRLYEDDCRVVRVKFRSHGRWVYSRRLICRD